jgi:hypothetical protein
MDQMQEIRSAEKQIAIEMDQMKCPASTSFAYHNSETILLPDFAI